MTGPSPGDGQRKRVIILGGGLGGLSAAWQLSQQDGYDIEVYQQGWRLGGKGASSRNPAEHNRIEEHGLHIWLGFYENAFRMLHECYQHAPMPAFPSVWDAFKPASRFVLQEDRPGGWTSWDDSFPEPHDGDPGDGSPILSPWQQLVRALELSFDYLMSATRTSPEVNPKGSLTMKPVPRNAAAAHGTQEHLSIKVARQLGAAALSLPASVLEHPIATLSGLAGDALLAAAVGFAIAMPYDVSLHSASHHGFIRRLVEQAAEWGHQKVLPLVKASDSRRRDWYLADILLACVRGIFQDGVLTQGFGVIDDYDFREWLHTHGADRETVECSLVRTVAYDLQFAYRDGNPATPACSAATALQGLFRLFLTYKKAIAWKMQAGMGDVVFAPMYRALRTRGVKFKFFHKVESLHLTAADTAGNRRLESIKMLVQAKVPRGEYDPLIPIPGADGIMLDAWPATPKPDVTPAPGAEGSSESYWFTCQRKWTLRLRDDDEVILAIPVGAQRGKLCQELRDNERWNAMLDNMGAIWTQSLQLWFKETPDDLGWTWGNGTLGGYIETFDTCADMSQLIGTEGGASLGIEAIAYLCNAMPTPPWADSEEYKGLAEAATGDVRKTAAQFLREDAAPIWPRAVRRYPSDFEWKTLYDPKKRPDEQRLEAQYVRANSDPSESYVLPLPGTGRYRIHPGDSGYANLKLAGDWTDCGINAGCVEAAVMSGMLAARAISGFPSKDQILGYHGH